MHKKIKGVLFSILLIVAVVAMGSVILEKSINNNTESNTVTQNSTSSIQNMENIDDSEVSEQEKLDKEYAEYVEASRIAGEKRYIGNYKNSLTSAEVNADFVVSGEYSFRQIYTYNTVEFLGYEEIYDLSEYFEGATWNENEMDNYVEKGFTSRLKECILFGYINKDGTLNTLTRQMEFRGGEEIITENLEIVAVKLKIKYTNLSNQTNQIWFGQQHSVEDLVIMDDGKLYTRNSIYMYDNYLSSAYGKPIYSTMHEKFATVFGVLNSHVIELGPKEEYVGEVIYLFAKQDFDNIYFLIDSGLHGNDAVTNHNAVGLRLLPLTELKKLEGK